MANFWFQSQVDGSKFRRVRRPKGWAFGGDGFFAKWTADPQCVMVVCLVCPGAVDIPYFCVFAVLVTMPDLGTVGARLYVFGTVFCGVCFNMVTFETRVYVCI